jgi:hypothetical protein
MRRWLSIFLVLLFGLWPLTGTLEASDDASLPACCRRHGAHHCDQAMQMAAMMAKAMSGSTPVLSAPTTCPLYPSSLAGPSTPSHALTATVANLPNLLAVSLTPVVEGNAARMRPIRTHAGRGPPASTLS